MRAKRFFDFLHRQIPVLIALSIFPGLGYLFLGWMNGIFVPAFVWYLLVIAESAWGYYLYRAFAFDMMSDARRDRWYRGVSWYFYSFFALWVLIFLIYVQQDAYKLHYIAIFTEIGASVVASALLSSDRRLFRPTVFMLMAPLTVYFFLIGEWFGYVLTVFAGVFTWVLLYAANSSHDLLAHAERQATHDSLTGLRNRAFFIEHLQKRMNSLKESGGFAYLLLIDLDHFKTVNDSLGHDVGDKLLQSVAGRLLDQVPEGDIVARLGGDEFVVVGRECADEATCSHMANTLAGHLVASLKAPYVVDLHHLYISASIGVSLINNRSLNAASFIKEADIAMYEVKAKGRDGVFMFNEEMASRVERQLEIERLLHFAVAEGEIDLHYQPQFDHEGRLIGAESLVRWNSRALGTVPPSTFIPIAEQTGIIIELGRHILETGFKTLRAWHQAGIELQQFSINISMRQFTHYTFVEQVEAMTRLYLDEGLCRKVVFEVTESIIAEDVERVIKMMQRLKALGIRFSMDDFGTGYSSLSHLSRLPLDEIKIDRSFVVTLGQDAAAQDMIATILNMAHIFGLHVVAEGVETAGQRDFLLANGCRVFQGYYYSRPLLTEGFVDFYREHAAR